MNAQRAGLAVVALLGVLALGACSATPTPAASSPSPVASPATTAAGEPSATPLPTPSTEVTAGPLALPSCEALLPLAFVQERFGERTVAIDLAVAGTTSVADAMAGPAAAEAAAGAVQSELCMWGIPYSDSGFHAVAAELTPASADSLIAALRAAGTFEEQPLAGGVMFSREFEDGIGLSVAYVFVDTAWTTAMGTIGAESARSVASAAMDSVRTANPSLR